MELAAASFSLFGGAALTDLVNQANGLTPAGAELRW
jgi:hypothetical protein